MEKISCLICVNNGELHHIKTRKSGGCDSVFNLMPLCRAHHTQVHQIGINSFAEKYPVVKDWLILNDWNFNLVKKQMD
jgi:5-methylcytosine-specific restriction endonuclease McrA